jgi:hypothetical protein
VNTPFYWFLAFVTVVFGGSFLLWRKAIEAIGRQVTEHAKVNARAYVRGAVYVAIAILSDFKEVFEKLSTDVAAVLPWWSWLVLFSTPLLGGLITLGAFLDNSAQRNQPAPKNNP